MDPYRSGRIHRWSSAPSRRGAARGLDGLTADRAGREEVGSDGTRPRGNLAAPPRPRLAAARSGGYDEGLSLARRQPDAEAPSGFRDSQMRAL